jgi:hypothetical protein
MAEVDVTADDQRAAGVPKVKRESHEDSVAADAAKRIDQKPPRGAEARAEELAEARAEQDDSEPEVEVKLSDSVELAEDHEGEVTVNYSGGSFKVAPGETVKVKQSVVNALGDASVVEVAS